MKLEARSARDCFKVATTSLELARRSDQQWEIEHHSITGITFTAFSIEAMFNHFGLIYFKDWNELKKSRKDSHKRLFKAVNLPRYLGTNEYQVAKNCFYLRDLLAHGKTNSETLVVDLPKDLGGQSVFNHMMALDSKPFRDASYELLKSFVETTRKIEKDIETNGFYPNQEHIDPAMQENLCECPLNVTGIRSW